MVAFQTLAYAVRLPVVASYFGTLLVGVAVKLSGLWARVPGCE